MSRNPQRPALRPILSGAAATAGLAMTIAATPSTARAQTAPSDADATPAAAKPDSVVLGPVTVDSNHADGAASGNVNQASTGSDRLADTVKETPRVINVVPQEIIEQQRAQTLEQALRNVPGITLSTGEGRGGQTGDQFRIRGLSAAGDIYTDGLKDFGVYTHDVFDTEAVDVLKGPSGESFGVGNSGGLINQISKKAGLEGVNEVEQSIGSGPMYRTTADINQRLSDTTAFRANVLYQHQAVADRDSVHSERRGAAFDFGAGLGTDTTWHLNYSYMQSKGTPDMGVSMIDGPDGVYRPVTEYGLSPSTSYVRSNLDHDNTENHVVTSTLSHVVNDQVSVYNDTRFSHYHRDFAVTTPSVVSASSAATFYRGGNPALAYGAGGGQAYIQDGFGEQNVAGVKFDGDVLGLRNKVNAGLDLNYQDETRQQGTWNNRTNTQDLANSDHSYASGASLSYPASGKRSSSVQNAGVFVTDRVWLDKRWSVQAGVRGDYFQSKFISSDASIDSGTVTNRVASPNASLIFEPTRDSSIYFSYSRSNKPQGTDVATAVDLGTSQTPSSDKRFKPEVTDLYELGSKADFLDGRLGLNGAVFMLEKSNTYAVDPSTGTVTDGFTEAGLGERIKGFEAGVSGKPARNWNVYLNYAYLTGEVTASESSPTSIGNVAPDVSKHNVSVWTTYDLTDQIKEAIPGKVTVGTGVQYASNYWADSANTAMMPENISWDAMASYEYGRYSLALNGYNLTDHLNYSSSFSSSRAVPESGRTVMMTVGVKF